MRAMCDIKRGDDGEVVYRLHTIFPELPNSRLVEIRETDGGLTLSFSEMPDKSIAHTFAGASSPSAMMLMALTLMKRTLGENFLDDALDLVFSPVLEAVRDDAENAEQRLAQIAEDNAKRRQAYKDLMPLISKFVGDTDAAPRRSPLAFIGGIFKKMRNDSEEASAQIDTQEDVPMIEMPSDELTENTENENNSSQNGELLPE